MFIQKEPVLILSLNWNSRNAIQQLSSLVLQRSCTVTSLNGSLHFASSLDTSILDFPGLLGTRLRISRIVVRRLVGRTGLIFNPQGDEAMKDMLPRTCNKWFLPIQIFTSNTKTSPSNALIASDFQIHRQRLYAKSRRVSTWYWQENSEHKSSNVSLGRFCRNVIKSRMVVGTRWC